MMVRKRNIAIDVMKFIAALLITNSHMGIMYTKFSSLSTGGTIGDALFFLLWIHIVFRSRTAF